MFSYTHFAARYLLPHARKTGLLALCLFGSVGLQLYIPQIVRRFIDLAVGGGPGAGLDALALTFLALALANQGLTVASTYLSADVGWSATNQLREDLFRHALGLDMAYHKDRTPGEMIERIDGDVSSVANFFSQFVVRVSGALLMTLGVLVLLWREDWRVGLVLTARVLCVLFPARRTTIPELGCCPQFYDDRGKECLKVASTLRLPSCFTGYLAYPFEDCFKAGRP